jgi:hypothetical protein
MLVRRNRRRGLAAPTPNELGKGKEEEEEVGTLEENMRFLRYPFGNKA